MATTPLSPALLTQPIGTIDQRQPTQVLPTLGFTKVIQQIYDAQNAGAGSGTVTSVGLALPVSLFSISGSPVTSNGTLGAALKTQTANRVWAGPASGSAAAPTFRALVAADLPAVSATGVTILGQGNIPMIMAGSGSMGNNGALTLTTSLGVTYSNAYVYMPVGAIAAGSLAGWYYATFSSGTAGTVFNNTYTAGTPSIPGSPTPFATTGPGGFTGVTTTQNAYSLAIAGGTIGINGGIRVEFAASFTNSAATKVFALDYAATPFGIATVTTTQSFAAIWGFKNRAATGSQVSLTCSPSVIPFGAVATALAYGAVDSTSSQNLTLTITNATPASNNAVLENITVELLPGV